MNGPKSCRQRQKNLELRQAVEFAVRGNTSASLKKLQVVEIPDASTRRRELVADYMRLDPADRDKTLIVSGTNEARREINALVREATGDGSRFRPTNRFISTTPMRPRRTVPKV